MRAYLTVLIGVSLAIVILAPNVQAHTPSIAGDNESLETAMLVEDPIKSWAIYAELHEGGEAQYYYFHMGLGQTIYVQLFTSTAPENADFVPNFVLMGPGLGDTGTVPDYVERPNGSDALVVLGVKPSSATYEPFSPSTFYELAMVRMSAPEDGDYYIAVFEPDRGGKYGLAIGERESFTLTEWLFTPFSLVAVHEWEGQNVVAILAPMLITVFLGLAVILWRFVSWKSLKIIDWLGLVAGLMFLGSGAIVLTQMAIAISVTSLQAGAGITLMFALLPLILGIVSLMVIMKKESRSPLKTRVYLVILGALALVFWAGYIIGSILMFIASAMPIAQKETRSIEVQADV